MGEVGSNYATWYGKRSRVDQDPEQPAKRPHVQQFTDGAREHRVWLAKEKEYRTTINKLEEQIEKIKFDSSLQAAEDEGEKKRLTRENEALRAQIQRMKIAAETPVRSERDEKIITNLRRKVHDYDFDLTKAERDLLNAQAKLTKSAEEHARLAHQLKQKYDKEVAILQKKLVALENEMVKQIKDFKTEREHFYALIYQLQESMQQLQDQNNTDTQVSKCKAVMTSKESNTGVVDPPREIVESESELKEEVHRLKRQMAEMYQAWIRGHPPLSLPANYTENPVFIPPLAQAQNPTTVDLSPQHAPGFTPFYHYPGTSSQTFHAPPAKTTAYPAPISAPVFVAPP
nr:cingulin-like [Nicotiana tomentosiformis]